MAAGEQLSTFWKNASPLKRAAVMAAAAIVAALTIGGITYGAISAGGGDGNTSVLAATPSGPTPTPEPPTPTVEEVLRYFAAVLPTATATPEYRGGTGGGSSSGGGGAGSLRRSSGTGPGPIVSTDIRLSIPNIGLNTGVNGRSVGTDGQMGNPSGPWMVVWYTFPAWNGALGGYPGEPGANVVMAGHVDYINVGPAVFWSLRNLAPGDLITVSGANGPITYAVQWSRWAGPAEDFTGYVARQSQDSVTLITCIGGFSGGEYSNRLVVRGVRI